MSTMYQKAERVLSFSTKTHKNATNYTNTRARYLHDSCMLLSILRKGGEFDELLSSLIYAICVVAFGFPAPRPRHHWPTTPQPVTPFGSRPPPKGLLDKGGGAGKTRGGEGEAGRREKLCCFYE